MFLGMEGGAMTAQQYSGKPGRPLRSTTAVYSTDDLTEAVNKLIDLVKRHLFGGPTHMLVITEITKVIATQQRAGLVTAFEIGAVKAESIQVIVNMPSDQYTAENRRIVRSLLKNVGYRAGLYVDPHLMPEECDGEAG